jgi:actin cytoskeleton-regulatory complex protein SLA1
VEVPAEKMSIEDMQYVDKLTNKRSRPPSKQVSDDDIPLGLSRESTASKTNASRTAPPKKAPKIDWFDFFLSAGCDLDDCTRYAASFERDKIDESILPDITDATMRSLGLREGDIIRVTKAIEKRSPSDNLKKPSVSTEDQVRRDEELAKQLQAQDSGGSARSPAPNLFSGPGGVLKNPRRGRPQPSKSLLPSNVDLKAISTVSDQISRTASPGMTSPASAHPSLTPVQAPVRSSSAIPAASGFDDDAWTNRPSSTKPIVGTPPSTAPRAPSAPPAAASTAPVRPSSAQVRPSLAPAPAASPAQSSSASLAKTTESDIFNQLSRLSELRGQSTPSQPFAPPVSHSAPPVSNQNFSASPAPLAQFTQNSQPIVPSQTPPQPYNGPRGPFAPVPANQGLLQPLIPTQTGFNSFISTRPTLAPSFSGSQPQSSFLAPQPTGILNNQRLISQPQPSFLAPQPTGIFNTQLLISQPTGIPSGNFNPAPYQNPFNPLQSRTRTQCFLIA